MASSSCRKKCIPSLFTNSSQFLRRHYINALDLFVCKESLSVRLNWLDITVFLRYYTSYGKGNGKTNSDGPHFCSDRRIYETSCRTTSTLIQSRVGEVITKVF